jgi:hypothetical protein
LLGQKTEFTLHIKDGHDYRFVSERRSEIIEILKHRYSDITGKNLPIFGIAREGTAIVTVIEKEFKKGIVKFPTENHRIWEENVLKETEDTLSVKKAMATMTLKPLS